MKYTFFLFKIVIKYCWVFNYLGWYFFLHFISSTEVLFYFSYHSLYISFSIFLICCFRRAENFFFSSFLFLIYSFCILAPIVFNLVFNDLTKIFSSPCISFRCVLRNYFEISILFCCFPSCFNLFQFYFTVPSLFDLFYFSPSRKL